MVVSVPISVKNWQAEDVGNRYCYGKGQGEGRGKSEMETPLAQILVVDDIPANLKLLSNILSAQGYKVRPASDGKLALRSVATEVPDLILLDIKMPGMDGYEVCRQLKADPGSREIPVIFISALDELADKVRGFEAGGLDYITKPFEPVEVLARVKTHLRLRHLQQHMEVQIRQRTKELSHANTELINEISEHARTEGELRRANRSLTMISGCNQVLIHAKDEASLLQNVCQIIVDIGGYTAACVGLAAQDKTVARIVASAGCARHCRREARQIGGEAPSEDRKALATVIRTGEPMTCWDLTSDERFDVWCSEAVRMNCRSALTLPLLTDSQVLGALSVLSEHLGGFSSEEVQLLTEMTRDLSFGIGALRSNEERRRTAEELSQKRARLQSIVRSSPTGIAIVAGRRFLEVNRRLCEMVGYAESELVGSSTRMLFLGEDDFDMIGRLVAIVEQGLKDTASIETHFGCKDGGVIDVLLIATAITVLDKHSGQRLADNEGSSPDRVVQAINFTILDITERKRMEQELRDSEIQYRTIFENTGTAMVIIEEDTVVSLANAEFAALVGVSREELEGQRKWTTFFAENVLPQITSTSQGRRSDPVGGPKSFESRLRHSEGRLVEVFIAVVSIPGTTKTVASVIDLTEQKKMEKELFTAKKMEIIGQLAGGVAHEVRNPLNAILSISEALFQEEGIAGRTEYREYIEHIRTQVNRLSKLMTDLLGLGKPSRSADIRPVPLERLCANTIRLWKVTKLAQDYPVTFTCDGAAEQPWVFADSMRLQQAILNLMDNAAQCSPKGSGISLHIVRDSQQTITLRIQDSGVGIAQEKLERIFEPFFTLRTKGTGLGLTLVKHFIESMGGEITIRNNEPAPGCTAELILNLAERNDYEHETEDIAC